MWMVISCNRAFGTCPQGIMHMHQPYNLVNWCEVITFSMTLTQQLKMMDQAERTQQSECGSRARAKETPEQRAQRSARWREQYRERRDLIVWECPRALSSTVEESLQQTSIARSGLPHNALHYLVYITETRHILYTIFTEVSLYKPEKQLTTWLLSWWRECLVNL